jgi:uncharacterized membrane-anchored protein
MNWRLILFGLLAAVQIAVPWRMIQHREHVLLNGELFRFKTEPIDPADPFQGRYVWLRIEEDYVHLTEPETDAIDYNASGYAILDTDAAGFAHFSTWSAERPTEHANYLKTKAHGQAVRWEDLPELTDAGTHKRTRIHQGLRIDIPFTRFYMDENKAPRAEIRARQATRNQDCWVEVRILNGAAVIEDVIAEGQSLRDLASQSL